MPNLRGTDYSQYYDLARMQAVRDETYRLAKEGQVPSDIVEMFVETRELLKKKGRR